MADNTKIEWTDATWNPITGCSIVSPGCTNCYAMKLAGTRLRHHPSRTGLTKDSKAGPVWTGEVRFNREWLDQPLRWKRPRMIFVCAHGDLFAEGVPDEWIDQIFAVMALCPQHTFQVLTKRPERMRGYLYGDSARQRVAWAEAACAMNRFAPDWRNEDIHGRHRSLVMAAGMEWPLPNVWLGASVEDQKRADERLPLLRETPAQVRWTSAEPLLGSLDLSRHIDILDWVVVGGESGHGARPMQPEWAESLRDQCAAAGVPFLFKQWGSHKQTSDCNGRYMIPATKKEAGRLLDGIEHNGFPEVRR
ncbi:protein gp37 [Rhizobium subbaraonis]|uniref:Protein gp37 n=1 Tax=Rhizobium subbaraonis TaxID=908946 RepID=A0A285UKN2_9HYPH|nr:phage Gp37/Gp68 family protein [Rhizobium subbaraonis]SOC42474.1 protein gp37 [Rhizobium subbaraonis]